MYLVRPYWDFILLPKSFDGGHIHGDNVLHRQSGHLHGGESDMVKHPYLQPSTGRPRSCVLSSAGSCPNGFGCNLVSGTVTRCCGQNFGCPYNSAGFLNPNTGSYVACDLSSSRCVVIADSTCSF
jgi:hypothetical protein